MNYTGRYSTATAFASTGTHHSGHDWSINRLHLRMSLKLLTDLRLPLCRSILRLLSDGESLTVTQIFIRLRVDQSPVSQALTILRRHGMVSCRIKGRNRIYSICEDRIEQINAALDRFCNPQKNNDYDII